MSVQRRIYLETKPVGGSSGGAGHLYLVYGDVRSSIDGYAAVPSAADLVIRGGPAGLLNFSQLAVQTGVLYGSSDSYGRFALALDGSIIKTEAPDDTPETRHSLDITDDIIRAGVYRDAQSAWAGMTSFAEGLNGQYRYELPDPFASTHVSNSNATILTVLNHAGLDVRQLPKPGDDFALYVDSFFSSGHPGADLKVREAA